MEAKTFVVINTVHRRPAGGTPRAHKPAGRLTVGPGTPLPRNRPFTVSLVFIQAHLEELKQKAEAGLLEVRERSINGPVIDLAELAGEEPVEKKEEPAPAPEPKAVEEKPDQEEAEEVVDTSDSESGGDTLDDEQDDFFADDESEFENMTKRELINVILEREPNTDERVLARMNKNMLLERLS